MYELPSMFKYDEMLLEELSQSGQPKNDENFEKVCHTINENYQWIIGYLSHVTCCFAVKKQIIFKGYFHSIYALFKYRQTKRKKTHLFERMPWFEEASSKWPKVLFKGMTAAELIFSVIYALFAYRGFKNNIWMYAMIWGNKLYIYFIIIKKHC